MLAELLIVYTMSEAGRLPASDPQQAQYSNAARQAAQAYYIQSGLNRTIDENLKRYERRFSEELRTVAGWGFWCAKTIQDQKITYSWEF